MADINIRFDDHGSQERIEKVAVFLHDLRSFWPLLVPVVTGWWRKQFDTEGSFGGEQWAPLSDGYASWKRLHYPGRGILVATGDLKRAASNPQRAVTPTSLTLTIDDPKLEYLQTGTDRMPARPLVFDAPLPAGAQAELDAIAEHYITDLLARV